MKIILITGLYCVSICQAFAPITAAFVPTTRSVVTTTYAEMEVGAGGPRPDLPIEYEDDDAAFADDEEWITESVPGKVVLNEVELAQQVSALSQLEEKWRKDRVRQEYDDAALLGWSKQAETYNSRFAMFFLTVGLLTEYWTGVTIPGQIEEMLRVGGFIDVGDF